ncbi:MAG: hypothetical protein KDB14_22760, partial [Planctomycetales bacterium]|nr:hypothetical protein [Planctomycetales bacterium]
MPVVDPYRECLGIQPEEHPPNLYRLLGVDAFEPDSGTILEWAGQQLASVRELTADSPEVGHLLSAEIQAAVNCLLDPQFKAEYDRQLAKRLKCSPPPRGAHSAPGKKQTPAERTGPTPSPKATQQVNPASLLGDGVLAAADQAAASQVDPISALGDSVIVATDQRAASPADGVGTRRPAVRPRRKKVSPMMELVKIVLGGAAGIAIGTLFLWFGLGRDPFGLFTGTRSPRQQVAVGPEGGTSGATSQVPVDGTADNASDVAKAKDATTDAAGKATDGQKGPTPDPKKSASPKGVTTSSPNGSSPNTSKGAGNSPNRKSPVTPVPSAAKAPKQPVTNSVPAATPN